MVVPPKFLRLFRMLTGCLAPLAGAGYSSGQAVFINEIHYDNNSTDSGEGVEIAGPAGTNLADYDLVFYNGSTPQAAVVYATLSLSGELQDMANGHGVAWFGPPANGIQNGGNDGVALYRKSTAQVVQLLSYEGVLMASGGVAAGMTSVDIGVAESATSPVGQSLQLTGSGTAYQNFHWAASQPATPGQLNPGQTFGSGGSFSTVFSVAPASVAENAGAAAATGTVVLTPAPASPVTLLLSGSDFTEITVPPSVEVPVSGIATFSIGAVPDGAVDGTQTVTITAADAAGNYPTRQVGMTVADVDTPPTPPFKGTIRVATFNVLYGVGSPGSPEFLAVKSVLQQINADVIAFQEVSDGGGFADLKALVSELGFQTTRTFFATDGDAVAGQTFKSGDFGNGTQALALASRFPITQTVQIGLGESGRKEMTRYPLFVSVDIPEVPAQQDPAFVGVHLKANEYALGTEPQADQFRRCIEAYRVRQFLQQNGWDGAARNVFVLGDFNQNGAVRPPLSFDTGPITGGYEFPDGTDLPPTYQLGADLTGANGITLTYDSVDALFPHTAFSGIQLASPRTRQADGATASFKTFGNSQLDYIFAAGSVVNSGLAVAEIYNSVLEPAFDGLPKAPQLPAPNTSCLAADHLAVFGDFALGAMPRLTLTSSAALFQEGSAPVATTLTLTLSEAPAEAPVTVRLSTPRPGRVRLPVQTVTFTAGQTTATLPLEILHPPAVEPHRSVTISATADGWFPATASVEIRNLEAGGEVLITQYIEPAATSEPKAIEIMNVSGADLDFSVTPLMVRRFSNGETAGEYEARVTSGVLESGQVMVIGGAPAGDYLQGEGIIVSNNGATPQTAPTGTPFFNAAGKLRYWKDTFTYNGDDALEILLHFTRQDVLGMIGNDPGTAWSGDGVSTANQNLALRGTIATGSAGFTDPSARFMAVGNADALTGFGIPPVLNDPYLAWVGAFGLAGRRAAPLDDWDGDGRLNLLEYALLSDPAVMDGSPPWQKLNTPAPTFSLHRRSTGSGLTTLLQGSPDLQVWTPQAPGSITNHGDGTETIITSPSANPLQFFRLEARRE